MKFREFTVNNHSTREFLDESLEEKELNEIKTYLDEVNNTIGKEKGFAFVLMRNGDAVYKLLEGIGGYNGLMIKSPHYIGLQMDKLDHEIELLGGFYMQSIVKKIYDLELDSCWVTLKELTPEQENVLLEGRKGIIQHALAFGKAEKQVENSDRHTTIINCDAKYEQNPYGLTVITTDETRESVIDTIFLQNWGNPAPFSEMQKRGVLDLLYYVRNSPSYQNTQPCRLILKDGYAQLVVINPENEDNYIDAGVMLFMLEGLAKELSFPSNWHYINDESGNKDYRLVAHFDL